MNRGRGNIGRAKHRQAFGHDIVSRHVKLHLEREANRPRRRRPREPRFDSVAELFRSHRRRLC